MSVAHLLQRFLPSGDIGGIFEPLSDVLGGGLLVAAGHRGNLHFGDCTRKHTQRDRDEAESTQRRASARVAASKMQGRRSHTISGSEADRESERRRRRIHPDSGGRRAHGEERRGDGDMRDHM